MVVRFHECSVFSPTEVKRLASRRAWIVFPGALLGTGATLGAMALFSIVREPLAGWTGRRVGVAAGEMLPVLFMMTTLAPFLAILIWAEKISKRFALVCPNCGEDVSRLTPRILATRCCSSCRTQIIEGRRTYSESVHQRYRQLKQRQSLVYWFWVWPVVGLAILVHHWFDPSALRDCPQCLWLFGLIGTTASGWAFIRTMDRRYAPQAVLSLAVLILGLLL